MFRARGVARVSSRDERSRASRFAATARAHASTKSSGGGAAMSSRAQLFAMRCAFSYGRKSPSACERKLQTFTSTVIERVRSSIRSAHPASPVTWNVNECSPIESFSVSIMSSTCAWPPCSMGRGTR